MIADLKREARLYKGEKRRRRLKWYATWDGFHRDDSGAVIGHWLLFKCGSPDKLTSYEKTDLNKCKHCGVVGSPRKVRERKRYVWGVRWQKINDVIREQIKNRVLCNDCWREVGPFDREYQKNLAYRKLINRLKRTASDVKETQHDRRSSPPPG